MCLESYSYKMAVEKTTRSSQESIEQPPAKRMKLESNTQLDTRDESFNFSFLQTQATTRDSLLKKITVRKGDNMKKRIDQLLKVLELGDEDQKQVLIMAAGDSIQKLMSILEILKKKLIETESTSYEQFNKLDGYEIKVQKNEILEKKQRVPVFYSLIRVFKKGKKFVEIQKGDDLKQWTNQV